MLVRFDLLLVRLWPLLEGKERTSMSERISLAHVSGSSFDDTLPLLPSILTCYFFSGKVRMSLSFLSRLRLRNRLILVIIIDWKFFFVKQS